MTTENKQLTISQDDPLWNKLDDTLKDPHRAEQVIGFCASRARQAGMSPERLDSIVREGYNAPMTNNAGAGEPQTQTGGQRSNR